MNNLRKRGEEAGGSVTIMAGGTEFRRRTMSLTIARKVLKEFQRVQEQKDLDGMISPLPPREDSILKMLYEGCSYKEIADRLSLSNHTVHTHVKNIYAKLHVNSRAQAIYEALRQRIIRQ